MPRLEDRIIQQRALQRAIEQRDQIRAMRERQKNPTFLDQVGRSLPQVLCMGSLGILAAVGAALKRVFGGSAASASSDTSTERP
jgi:hypothetical protein